MNSHSNRVVNGSVNGSASRRLIQTSKSISSQLQLLLDIAIVEGLLFLFVWLKGINDFSLYYYPALIAPALMWLVYSNSGVYQRLSGKIGRAFKLLWAWSKVMGILVALAFISKYSEDFSRQVIALWFVAGAIAQMAAHIITSHFIRFYFAKRKQTIASIIVGNSELGGYLAKSINSNPWTAHKIVGVVCEATSRNETWHIDGLPRIGDMDELHDMVEKYQIRRVYFALPMKTAHQIRELQVELIDLNVDIIWAPDFFGLHMVSPSVKEVAGVPLFYLSESPMVEGAMVSKWLFDKAVAFAALILLAPLMISAAIAVKLSSTGPIFFRQQRHGLDGKIINVMKFRSMVVHKEEDGVVTQAQKGDRRVTRVGAFIRKTSIDELPQLFNVLKGDMSLVGPRPHAVAHNHYYSDKVYAYMARHRILPGITGLAQVSGCRGETDTLDKMEKRVEYDLTYINSWSIWMDIKIIIKTVVTLFSKNAY